MQVYNSTVYGSREGDELIVQWKDNRVVTIMTTLHNANESDLVDRKGEKHVLWGYGIDTIIEPEEPSDLSSVMDLFPHIPEEVFTPLPKKRIDILVGLNFNGLFPSGGEGNNCVGNLKVLSTIFGTTGFVLGGSHPLLKCQPLKFSSAVAQLRVAKVTVSPAIEVSILPEYLPVSKEIPDKLAESREESEQVILEDVGAEHEEHSDNCVQDLHWGVVGKEDSIYR